MTAKEFVLSIFPDAKAEFFDGVYYICPLFDEGDCVRRKGSDACVLGFAVMARDAWAQAEKRMTKFAKLVDANGDLPANVSVL